jgi:RimJ/RimL family protein N-acetyltransferase
MTVLETSRLRMEPMTEAHFDGLYALNSDPDVMRYIRGVPDTIDDTHAMIKRVKERWVQHGFSWWSFIEKETGELIGAGAIQPLGHQPGNPHEAAWRLRKDKWGQGYAIEAAKRMAAFAFDTLDAPLLCAVCQPANVASSRVMERLGMHYTGEETWYGSPLSMYRITRDDWFRAHPVQPG